MVSYLYLLQALLLVSSAPVDMSGKVLYQLLVDRFAPDDPSAKPCRGTFEEKYCGGSLKGITTKLDYIVDLHVDGVLLTPLFDNSPTSFMGYSVVDYHSINPHFGTFADVQALADACHTENLLLFGDMVFNNVSPVRNYSLITPFNSSEYYHEKYSYCTTQPYNYNVTVMTNCWIGELPDLNQDHPFVKSTLVNVGKEYKNYGFDGFRMTTAWAMPQSFIEEFTAGVDTFTIAEVPFEKVDFASSFQGPASSVYNYEMNMAMRLVFQKQDSFSVLAKAVADSLKYPNPELVANYLDDPDNYRFRVYSTSANYKNALAWLLTFTGIPVLFYGDEQGYVTQPQTPVWPHYDTANEYFMFINKLLSYRRAEKLWIQDWVELKTTATNYVAKRGNTLLVFTNTEQEQTVEIALSGEYCDIYTSQCFTSSNDVLSVTTKGDPLIMKKKLVRHDDSARALLGLSLILALILT